MDLDAEAGRPALVGGGAVEELLAPLLPPSVSLAAAAIDGDEPVLHDEELAAVRGAVAKRRREVAFGRDCARRALAQLGAQPVTIPRGEGGAPVWPPGIVGSITHCDEVAAAAVARGETVRGLGID